MLQINNKTPFASDMVMHSNENAINTLYVLVKATFLMKDNISLAEEQEPLIQSDEYWVEPGKSSIRISSDYHLGKQTSDIIVLGHAFSPLNSITNELDVSLSVGKIMKNIKVFGDRQWLNGNITTPLPFKTMAMIYEKAFGGTYYKENSIESFYSRNPVGRGYSGNRTVKQMNGVFLPNLETPSSLISDIHDTPEPACFSVCAPHWEPRSLYAGTYNAEWENTRSPYLPHDFNKKFFNSAHEDLIYPDFLVGGEAVEITNMHKKGNVKFKIPILTVNANVSLGDNICNPDFNIETLILEPNKLQFSLVLRASVECDKHVLDISDITINLRK